MSDFEPNELNPGSSNHHQATSHSSGGTDNSKKTRQYLMIGLGLVILLVLIITITSALKSPSSLPNSESSDIKISVPTNYEQGQLQQSDTQQIQPQEITGTPVTPMPTEAQSLPINSAEQQIEITGDLADALASKQNAATGNPALSAAAVNAEPAPQALEPVKQQPTAKSAQTQSTINNRSVNSTLTSLPAGYYTLQLSGATQAKTLEIFARSSQLNQYWIYETRRSGKPWFVLISGSYATVSAAKNAITSLPADVQSKQPWVKPIRQVQKELGQR